MKNSLLSLIMGLALLTGVCSALAQVTNLGIAPGPGGQSILYWPVSSMNYVLQTTTNLATPNWVTASNAVTVNAATVTNSAPEGYFRLVLAIPAGMALIPAGWFTMGDTLDGLSNANPTNIYVSAFYMDVNEVSLNQWRTVYNYATNRGYGFVNAGLAKAANHPVHSVNWFDCVKWSNARSQQAGLTPVYYTDLGLTQVFTSGESGTTVYQNLAANGYRLPTEAEWEKAARGGLSGQRFPWGNYIGESQANYFGDTNSFSYDFGPNGYNPLGGTTSPRTTPVGTFPANGYGLYDMAGNVHEWCWDWYGTPYGQPTTNNPTGAEPGFYGHVLRGGCWDFRASESRCAERGDQFLTSIAFYWIGFRCVRGL